MNWHTRRGPTFWGGLLLSQAALIGLAGAAAVAHPASRPMDTAEMARMAATGTPAGTAVLLHKHLVRVAILNFAFKPARLVVSPGTQIVWTNGDSDPHTVVSTKNIWSSEALDTGDHFARVFRTAGTFPYYCGIHPYMHGTITVQK